MFCKRHEIRHPYRDAFSDNTLSYWDVLKVPVRRYFIQGVIFGLTAQVIAMSFYQSVDPILPFKLSREFGMDEHGIAVFFLHFTAVVVLVGLLSSSYLIKLTKCSLYFLDTSY